LKPVFAGPGHPHASRLPHGLLGLAHDDGNVVEVVVVDVVVVEVEVVVVEVEVVVLAGGLVVVVGAVVVLVGGVTVPSGTNTRSAQ
jgi:hypothetical protein